MSPKMKAKSLDKPVEERKKGAAARMANIPDTLHQVLQQSGNRALQRILAPSGQAEQENAAQGMLLAEKVQSRIDHQMHATQTGSSGNTAQRAEGDYAFEDEEMPVYGEGNNGVNVDAVTSERGDENDETLEGFANQGYEINNPTEMQQGNGTQETTGGTGYDTGGGNSPSEQDTRLPSADYFNSQEDYDTVKNAEQEGYQVTYPPELEEME